VMGSIMSPLIVISISIGGTPRTAPLVMWP